MQNEKNAASVTLFRRQAFRFSGLHVRINVNATQLDSCVASASAVCIGRNKTDCTISADVRLDKFLCGLSTSPNPRLPFSTHITIV